MTSSDPIGTTDFIRRLRGDVPPNNRLKLTSGGSLEGRAPTRYDGGARIFIESPLAADMEPPLVKSLHAFVVVAVR